MTCWKMRSDTCLWFWLFFAVWCEFTKGSGKNLELLAPLEVLVDEVTSDSISLSWKRPPVPAQQPMKLFTYTLVLTPLSIRSLGQEKEFSLPPAVTSKTVKDLKEGTQYAVLLSAVYGDFAKTLSRDNLKVVSAPKFTVSVPTALQRDVPIVGDDGVPLGEPPCNCSEAGMVACTRRPGFVECTCQLGYAGKWCEKCAPGNFMDGKECKVCPCSNTTSTAQCQIDGSHHVRCIQCLPGHRGSLCTSCTSGYHWVDDKCIPLDCLSSSDGCTFLENRFPSSAQRSNSDRSIADGTLPLIAVVVTLGILLLVAAMATCYRYWTFGHQQPRIPFWSIELQDDKSDLHAHCQYQHLDAVTNRAVFDGQSDGQQQSNGTFKNEEGRLTTDPQPKTYNTMDV